MGTNAVFANKGDGQHTGMTGKAGPGTNSVRIPAPFFSSCVSLSIHPCTLLLLFIALN